MARKDNLDFVDQAVESANLQEKSTTPKNNTIPKKWGTK